jgi:hypothetical protein
MSGSARVDGDATVAGLAATVARLSARLRAVEDVQAIERLKARYGELVDRRYGPHGIVAAAELDALATAIADLFTADAVWDGGKALGLCRGRAAIRERFREPTLSFSWHFFVKPRIEVSGDRARGTWDILAPCTTQDGRAQWMAGVEEDEYERVDDRWLHRSMKLRVVFLAPYEGGWAKTSDAARGAKPPDPARGAKP